MKSTLLLALVSSSTLLACSDYQLTEALDEPFSVEGGQFIEGELPGSRPLSHQEIADGAEVQFPRPTPPSFELTKFYQGQAGVYVKGWASDDAQSIGIRFEKLGTGYWIFPAGAVDPLQQNTLNWGFTANFHHNITPGLHRILATAFDAEGKSGTQSSTTICISSLTPDNDNVCYPETSPPAVVLGLTWDRPVDLDLVVVPPSGEIINPKTPTSARPNEEGVVNPNSRRAGNLDLDSNQDCRIDGRQREHVIWKNNPRPGTYAVYANLYRTCGEDSVRYQVTLHSRTFGEKPDTYAVARQELAEGLLTSFHANGSVGTLGTYVTQFTINE